jgi:hypothetical protein
MKPRPLTLLGACLILAGCGGGAAQSTTTSTSPKSTVTSLDATAQLEQAVRSAVDRNAELSNYVLWHNAVPSWATRSTDGPALTELRGSAAERKAQDLQLRGVSQRVAILSIALDPSYTSATAKVRESGSVVPYRHGRRLGRPLRLNEVAQVELHRADSSPQFVVWKVGPAR